MNPAAVRALGCEANAVLGRSLAEFLAPSVRTTRPEYLGRMEKNGQDFGSVQVVGRDKARRTWLYRNLVVRENGSPPYVVGHAMDITAERKTERRLQIMLRKLERALAEVKTLKGLLPTCAWCKRIRTENGHWTNLESYVKAHSEAIFSHGICPDCLPNVRDPKKLL
jgi:PAS domain S-box-containing protein